MSRLDEIPPKWISTSKAEYTLKTLVNEKEKIKEGEFYFLFYSRKLH